MLQPPASPSQRGDVYRGKYESSDPADIYLFCGHAVLTYPYSMSDPVQQTGTGHDVSTISIFRKSKMFPHDFQSVKRHNVCQVLAIYVNVDSLSTQASGIKTEGGSITCITNKNPLTQIRCI